MPGLKGRYEKSSRFSLTSILASRRHRGIVLTSAIVGTVLYLGSHLKIYQPLSETSGWSLTVSDGYDYSSVDWSRFAYTQYATNTEYICNSVMLFESLDRKGSKADRLLMYSDEISISDPTSKDVELLLRARNQYNVKLLPVQIQKKNQTGSTWADSFTKLLAFNQTQYSRVLHLDSDGTLLKPLDELFLSTPTNLSLPFAYWLPNAPTLTTLLLLVTPSQSLFSEIQEAIENANEEQYDMELINDLYKNRSTVLPHRPHYALTSEFHGPKTASQHFAYLGNAQELWDPEKVMQEVRYLHFSDWPVAKPWATSKISLESYMDSEGVGKDEREGRDWKIWLGLYEDFGRRRANICGLGLWRGG